jgi:hypothetical protein
MNRRSIIIGLAGLCASLSMSARRAFAWVLITQDESIAEKKALEDNKGIQPAEAPPGSDAPVIEVLEPDTTKPIKSPVKIRIRFRPQSGSTINPKTFRAKYGWLGIDITDRLAGHAQIDASGLSADNAEIPAGQYAITLQVADSMGRVGTRALEFRAV